MNFKELILKTKLQIRKWRAKNRFSLSQDFYVFVSISVIVALLASALFTWTIYETQKNNLQEKLNIEAKLIDNALSDFLLNVKRITEDKGRKIALKGADDLDNIFYLLRRQFSVDNFNDSRAIKSLKWPHFSWVTPDGYVKVKSDEGVLAEPEKIREGNYLTQALQVPWKLHLSKPVYNYEVDNTVIYAALGVFDSQGNFLGAITTQFEPGKIVRAINERVESENTNYVILDQDMDIIMSSFAEFDDTAKFTKTLGIRKFEENIITMPTVEKKYKGTVFTSYITSSNYPFFIFTGYNSNISQKEFLIESGLKVLYLFGLAFILLLVLFIFYRVTIKPIYLLSIAADKILSGERVKQMPRGKSKETHQFAVILLRIQRYIRERNQRVQQLNKMTKELEIAKQSLLVSNKELKAEKAKSIESKRNRERFISRVKHEIQNPLSSVEGFIQVLIEKEKKGIPVDKATMLEYLNNALEAVKVVKTFTTNNLVISKVSVRERIEECINIQSEDILINEINLKKTIGKNIPDIFADELRFNQIVTALIYRAIEDDPDNISIAVNNVKKAKKDYLKITFVDDGIGYTEEERTKLFQRYNHGPISRQTNGTALALPAIEKLVELHLGKMKIKSTKAKGTTIEVVIPYRSEKEANSIPDQNDESDISNVVHIDFGNK